MPMKIGAAAEPPKNKGGRPKGSKNKSKQADAATEAKTPPAGVPAAQGTAASPGFPMPSTQPEWVTALLNRWGRIEEKLDLVLSAIETDDEPAAREPPKERPALAPVPAPKEPPPAEAALEERGYVNITIEELEAMNRDQLIELANEVGADIQDCIKSERVIRKRLMVLISKSAELYEAQPRRAKTN